MVWRRGLLVQEIGKRRNDLRSQDNECMNLPHCHLLVLWLP